MARHRTEVDHRRLTVSHRALGLMNQRRHNMPTRKLSDTQVAITVVPRRARWPERSVAPVWAKAHDCVDAWHNVARKVDSSARRS
jgi:hypothetical protein